MSCESDKVKWTTESTCKLIELYRETPLLWDNTNKEYKNRYKKADALRGIATSLNITSVDEVDRKIRNLNSQYMRERRNYKKLKKSGAGKYFHAKWFGYSLLSFLQGKNRNRKNLQGGGGLSTDTQETDSSADDSEEIEMKMEASDAEQIQIDIGLPDDMGFEQTDTQDCQDTFNNTDRDIESRRSLKKRKKVVVPPKVEVNNKTEDIYGIMNSIRQDRQERGHIKADDFDVFGDLVARKLRGLRTRYAQCTVQHLIHSLLYEAEIGQYDEPNRNPKPHLQQEL